MAKRTFSTVQVTAPSAGDPLPTSRRTDAETPRRQETETPRRQAYTWRQTNDQADQLDDLVRTLRRSLNRRVTKADVVDAMLTATRDPAVQTRLAEILGGR